MSSNRKTILILSMLVLTTIAIGTSANANPVIKLAKATGFSRTQLDLLWRWGKQGAEGHANANREAVKRSYEAAGFNRNLIERDYDVYLQAYAREIAKERAAGRASDASVGQLQEYMRSGSYAAGGVSLANSSVKEDGSGLPSVSGIRGIQEVPAASQKPAARPAAQ